MRNAHRVLILLASVAVACLSSARPSLAQWAQTAGPGIASVQTVFVQSQLYAGTFTRGVFRSTDHGAHWLATSGILETKVNCFTADGTALIAGVDFSGAYRSTDGGATWQPANNGLGSITVSCLMTTGGATYAGTLGAGVFKSTDHGASWFPSNNGLSTEMIQAMTANGTRLFAAGSNNLYQSTDGGVSWEFTNGGQFFQVSSLFSDAGTNIVYGGGIQGVIRSTDGGSTWGNRIDILWLKPLSRLTSFVKLGGAVYASTNSSPGSGGNGVIRSTDGGLTWSQAGSGIDIVGTTAVVVDGASLVAAAPDKGPLVSADGGATWARRIAGFPVGGNIRDLASLGNVVFAGTQGDGVYRSDNQGASWVQKSVDPNGRLANETVLSLYASGSVMLAGTGSSGMFRSTDGGETWTSESDGFPDPNLQVLDFAATTTNTIAGTGVSVFYSGDQGASWLPGNTPEGTVTNVAASGSTGYANVVTGIFTTDGIYRSTNNGVSWNLIFQSLDASFIAAMAARGSFAWAGVFTGGMIRSSNGGSSWTDDSPEAGIGIFSLYLRSTSDVYAGSDADGAGVYRSTNQGDTWVSFGDGLPTAAPVNGITATDIFLFAGTEDDGVWRRTLPGATDVGPGGGDRPGALVLEPCFPNPSRLSATARFALPSAGPARLLLVDAAGRIIAEPLRSPALEAGEHTVGLDATRIAPGVYFLRLETPQGIRTSKLIVDR